MKKSIKKLSLNKTTVSNLDAFVMNQKVGGAKPTVTIATCNPFASCAVPCTVPPTAPTCISCTSCIWTCGC